MHNSHPPTDDDHYALLVEHAMGRLSAASVDELDQHLTQCSACQEELKLIRGVVERLLESVPVVEPSPGLWERITARIHGIAPRPAAEAKPDVQVWHKWAEGSQSPDPRGFVFAMGEDPRDAASGWEPTGSDGVVSRRLFVDRAADRVTMLVRMDPGASYPAHRHGGDEDCFVLEGDLWVGDERLRRGDYQHADAGSIHPEQSTEGGCLLFLVSSLHDEILPASA